MQRVDMEELDSEDGITYRWRGELFTGVGYELRPNGQLWDEIEYVEGKKQGLSRDWYPSGQLKAETACYNGANFGPHREWDEAGQLRREMMIEYGFRTREKQWDEAGHLTLDYIMPPDHSNYALLQKYRALYGDDPRPDTTSRQS